ncbi:hypothetical protein [Shouchella miscanthi]|nr:hypothetical protein [Shouchella miscanthi]
MKKQTLIENRIEKIEKELHKKGILKIDRKVPVFDWFDINS